MVPPLPALLPEALAKRPVDDPADLLLQADGSLDPSHLEQELSDPEVRWSLDRAVAVSKHAQNGTIGLIDQSVFSQVPT